MSNARRSTTGVKTLSCSFAHPPSPVAPKIAGATAPRRSAAQAAQPARWTARAERCRSRAGILALCRVTDHQGFPRIGPGIPLSLRLRAWDSGARAGGTADIPSKQRLSASVPLSRVPREWDMGQPASIKHWASARSRRHREVVSYSPKCLSQFAFFHRVLILSEQLAGEHVWSVAGQTGGVILNDQGRRVSAPSQGLPDNGSRNREQGEAERPHPDGAGLASAGRGAISAGDPAAATTATPARKGWREGVGRQPMAAPADDPCLTITVLGRETPRHLHQVLVAIGFNAVSGVSFWCLAGKPEFRPFRA